MHEQFVCAVNQLGIDSKRPHWPFSGNGFFLQVFV
jgi:hypothetical protein